MAGYSGTPLTKKLGIKDGHRLALLGAPTGFPGTLDPLPEEVHVAKSLRGKLSFDVLVLFCDKLTELERKLPLAVKRLATDGGLWISWPKEASGLPTDLTGDVVRATGLATGLVDNKVCAIDETWSGLRFVFRLKDRPARRRASSR